MEFPSSGKAYSLADNINNDPNFEQKILYKRNSKLKRSVEDNYESYWRNVIYLLSNKIIQYSDLNMIDMDELEQLTLASNKYFKELNNS